MKIALLHSASGSARRAAPTPPAMSDEKAKIFAKLHWEDAAAEDYADPKKAFTVYVAEPPDDWKEGMKHEIAL